MQDLLIERCTVRLVRHGGWSWGEDPRRLARRVLDVLPALIAARIGDMLADVRDEGVIATPIRVHIPMRVEQLRLRGTFDPLIVSEGAAAWIPRAEAALQTALRDVVIATTSPTTVVPAVRAANTATPPAWRILRDALVEWHRSGLLSFLLATSDEGVIETWLRMLDEPRAGREGSPLPADEPLVLERSRNHGADASTRRPPVDVAAQLAAIIEQYSTATDPRHPNPTGASRGTEGTSSPGPPRTELRASDRVAAFGDAPAAPASERTAAPVRVTPAPSAPIVARELLLGELHVPSALPWLILVPLQRLGFLQMVTVALQAAGVQQRASAFAASLAYKLAEPTERAWQKSAVADRLATAMAATRDPIPKAELHRFAGRLAPHCALLDALLADAVARGKAAEDPWLLQTVPTAPLPSFALIDPQGMFPAWWGADAARVGEALRTTERGEVIAADDAADRRLLERLAADGVRFVTRSRPGRGEHWTRTHVGGARQWWSNTGHPVSPGLRRWTDTADDLFARASSLTTELGSRRVAFPLDDGSALERTVSLAVAVALGTMAWDLWHAQEPTNPLLALSRLGDLDARVTFSGQRVRVVVPMGRRHRDLYEAGLLVDVRDVPWLDGRTLEFSGG